MTNIWQINTGVTHDTLFDYCFSRSLTGFFQLYVSMSCELLSSYLQMCSFFLIYVGTVVDTHFHNCD